MTEDLRVKKPAIDLSDKYCTIIEPIIKYPNKSTNLLYLGTKYETVWSYGSYM